MQQIGKYAIVGQIGTGGFGVVFEGHDPFLKRRVAIKTCSSEEPEIRDRFFREAEIAGNLRHRNIVTVHDFGVQDGIPYLVQEYLSGEDLDRLVARQEPLPAARRVEILLQAARGLEYAHSRGVIHRDIKPGNIRLTAEGVVKIMDFGIAKLANVASHLTRTGMTMGTAAYLPPEQIRGTAVDHRADVFSFGVTAYELLTYRRPFAGKTISALFWDLLQRPAEPLAHTWPQCPPTLDALVRHCLAKDPAERPPGFDVVVAGLQEVLTAMQRDEAPTAPHRPVEGAPPRTPAGVPAAAAGKSLRAAAAGPPRRPAARVEPRETAGGLLGDVQEALTSARHAAGSRHVRELLAAGDVEAAARELEVLPPGGEGEALRRQVAAARCDRLLVQAAASWGEGDPEGAIAQVEELLALDPAHADARRLRDDWRTEHQTRERQRQAALAQVESRRHALAAAVVRVEEPLARGDLEAADAALSAAIADLGSHQPLRDLRRRLAAARAEPGAATAAPARPLLLDQSTVGIDAARMAVARERAALEAARAAASRRAPSPAPPPAAGAVPPARPAPVAERPPGGAGGGYGSWSAPGSVAPLPPGPRPDPTATPAGAWDAPTHAGAPPADAVPGSPTARLALVLGALALLGLLMLALWWVISVAPASAPAPAPTASPASGIGGTADG